MTKLNYGLDLRCTIIAVRTNPMEIVKAHKGIQILTFSPAIALEKPKLYDK